MAGKQVSKLDIEYRVQVVADLIAGGMRTAGILQTVWDKWGIRRRQALAYVTSARQLLSTPEGESRDYWRNVSLRRYEDIYQRALAEENYRLALAAQEKLDSLRGLTQPDGPTTQTIFAYLPDARIVAGALPAPGGGK